MAPRKPKIVTIYEPENIEPANVTLAPLPEPEILTIGHSKYEEVGACAQCGTKVFKVLEGTEHSGIGNQLAVYVAFSHREPPGLYCQAHDPNLAHRMSFGVPNGDGTIPGDTWRPRAFGA